MADPTQIHNWHRLDDRLTTSGQPTEDELGAIAALGVRHVVNLGLHSHAKALPNERASVEALGMRYTHLPVIFDAPSDADFAAFSAVMDELAGEMIHVHCIANYRVSAFLYRYRRDILGEDEPAARADMERLWRPQGVWAEIVAPYSPSAA